MTPLERLKTPSEQTLKHVRYVLFNRMMDAMNVPLDDQQRRCQIKAAITVALPGALYAAASAVEEET